MAEAFATVDLKPGLLQAAAHEAGGGKGGEAAFRPGETRHGGEQLLGPHVGIFGRCEAVEKPGVDLVIHAGVELRQQFVDVAEPQIERNAAFGQQQTMAARQRQRPLGAQLVGIGASSGQRACAAAKSACCRGIFQS